MSFLVLWAPFHVQRLLARHWDDIWPQRSCVANATNLSSTIACSSELYNFFFTSHSKQNSSSASSSSSFNSTQANSNETSDTHSTGGAMNLQLFLFYGVGLLYYASAALNPVLYNLMSRDFRTAFQAAYLPRSCRLARRLRYTQYCTH